MKRTFLMLLCGLFVVIAQAQTDIFVNNNFEDTRFTMNGDYRWTHGTTTLDGCFAVSHNHNGSDYDLKVVYWDDDNATPHWQATHSGSENSYGVLTLHDAANEYFYAIGVLEDPNSGNDLLVIKYDDQGAHQWTSTWDAGSDFGEAPVAAVLNGGDLYITGVANHGHYEETNDDVFMLKMADDGTITWSNVYDYAGYNESPVAMAANSSYVYIVGSSYANSTTRDILLQRYSFTSSTPTNVRLSTSGNIDYATDIATDLESAGEFYFTGRRGNDAIIYKYDNTMTEDWSYTYDYHGKMDRAMGVAVLDDKVMMANECINNNGGLATTICELDKDNGNLIQVGYFEPYTDKGKRQIMNFENNGDNEPILTFFEQEQGQDPHAGMVFFNDDAQPMGYFKAGDPSKEYQVNHALKQGSKVYLLGTADVGGSFENLTIATETAQLDPRLEEEPVVTEIDSNNHVHDTITLETNHLTLVFNKESVFKDFLDNTDLAFGKIDSVLRDTFSDSLKSKLSYPSSAFFRKFDRWKITGDTIDSGYYRGVFTYADEAYALDLVFSEQEDYFALWEDLQGLYFVENVRTFKNITLNSGVPNDPKFGTNQFSLYPNTSSSYWNSDFSKGHMNLEPVWDEYSTGITNVKVGISEKKVYWRHEDFSNNATLTKSVVRGGTWYDDKAKSGYFSTTAETNHATRVAGIVGAVRNNSKGVAGIAGGTGSSDGVSLYTYNASFTAGQADAMVKDGVHIINQSFYDPYPFAAEMMYDYAKLLKKGVIIVTSKGNDIGKDIGGNFLEYPSALFPEQTISVGGFGNDGTLWKPHNERGWNPSVPRDWSKWGYEMDFLAPAWVTDYDKDPSSGTTYEVGIYTTDFVDETTTDKYITGTQTSAATPHVTGLAALLVSKHYDTTNNVNPLTPEDVERLIAMACVDIKASDEDDENLNADFIDKNEENHSEYRPMPDDGYDELTAWGRIDAEKAAYYAGDPSQSNPNFKLLHYKTGDTELGTPTFTTTNLDPLAYRSVQMRPKARNSKGVAFLNAKVKSYKVEITFTVDVPTGYSLFAPSWFTKNGVQQGAIWHNSQTSNLAHPYFDQPTQYSSRGFAGSAFTYVPEGVPYLSTQSVDVANKKVTLVGYLFEVEDKMDEKGNWLNVSSWYPFGTSQLATKATYGVTVHCVKNGVGIEDAKNHSLNAGIFPNPGSNLITVQLQAPNDKEAALQVFDISGRPCLSTHMEASSDGRFYKELNISSLKPGIYYFRWNTGSGQLLTRKFVKL